MTHPEIDLTHSPPTLVTVSHPEGDSLTHHPLTHSCFSESQPNYPHKVTFTLLLEMPYNPDLVNLTINTLLTQEPQIITDGSVEPSKNYNDGGGGGVADGDGGGDDS